MQGSKFAARIGSAREPARGSPRRAESEPENFDFSRARAEPEPENFYFARARAEPEPKKKLFCALSHMI